MTKSEAIVSFLQHRSCRLVHSASQARREATTAVTAPEPPRIPRTEGWWKDLISDENGALALDRLQVVVWTLVLSGIFLYSVIWEVSMPEFNGTLLALMGVSSGTYIGFKLPQRG